MGNRLLFKVTLHGIDDEIVSICGQEHFFHNLLQKNIDVSNLSFYHEGAL